MSGFCPDDFHGTTEMDLQQMAAGEDYEFWISAIESGRRRQHAFARRDHGRRQMKREYAIHDEAVAQAKRDGLALHLLPMAEQERRMNEAETRTKEHPTNG